MSVNKLTEEQKNEIITIYNQGITASKIIKIFSISTKTLKKILIQRCYFGMDLL